MRVTKPLTDTQIKKAKPKDKNYSLYDGDGLILEIAKTGSKLWRLKYKSPETRTDKKISLGKYPIVGIARAREKARDFQKQIDLGLCPVTQKKQLSTEEKRDVMTFEKASQAFLDKNESKWTAEHHFKQSKAIDRYLMPDLRLMPLEDIKRLDITQIIDKIQSDGKVETGLRIFVIARSIFKLQVSKGHIEHNPLSDIDAKDTFKENKSEPLSAPTDKDEIAKILKAINANQSGFIQTIMGLKILPHVFLRNESFRLTEWKHIDFDKKIWRVLAQNLKLRRKEKAKSENDMLIPMSKQVVEMLLETKQHTGGDKYVFPSPKGKNRPLSASAFGDMLKRLGFTSKEIQPHGFRSIFSTLFTKERLDHGLSIEAREIALDHTINNAVADTYDRSDMDTDEFKHLYQWWSNYLERISK